jgi:hypothetical protein
MTTKSGPQYFHISYEPENGWVLSIMTRLADSTSAQLRQAFKDWSATPLRELGIAVTTRMQMLGCCIHRLNIRLTEIRESLGGDEEQLQLCLQKGYAFRLPGNDLAYELLLDMESFIFESRSLYEFIGEFLRNLFEIAFQRQMKEKQWISILQRRGIDTCWIDVLSDTRKLFFHETAPWLAIEFQLSPKRFSPILLKRAVQTISGPHDFVSLDELHGIYDGFVHALTELRLFVMEEIRRAEAQP